jgi:hypothetical protein
MADHPEPAASEAPKLGDAIPSAASKSDSPVRAGEGRAKISSLEAASILFDDWPQLQQRLADTVREHDDPLPEPSTLTLGELHRLTLEVDGIHEHFRRVPPGSPGAPSREDLNLLLGRIRTVLFHSAGFQEFRDRLKIETGEPLGSEAVAEVIHRLARLRRQLFDEAGRIGLAEAVAILREPEAPASCQPKPPSVVPTDPILTDALIDSLRRERKHNPAALVEYMRGRETAPFDDIKDQVHGSKVEDGAVRKLVSETNKLMIEKGSKIHFCTRGGHVFRNDSSE